MSTDAEQPVAPVAAPPATPPDAPRSGGKRTRALPHLDHCLNCGTPTGDRDNYCSHCGQENENETVALRPLLRDFLSEIASWDSKIVRTVLPLLFRPGFLTNEYNVGRRIRYLSPLKMYLVISAFFFLALSPGALMSQSHVSIGGSPSAASHTVSHGKHAGGGVVRPIKGDSEMLTLAGGDRVDLGALPSDVAVYDAQQKDPRNKHKHPFLTNLVVRQIIRARQNKQSFLASLIQGLLTDLPRMMFVLLPLFALMLKMTYLRSKRFYVEHLIFALHSHAFTFAVLTVVALLTSRLGDVRGWETFHSALVTALVIALPVYLFAAMRRVYCQSWWKTFLKFNWLAFNYIVLLTVAFALTTVVAFLRA